MSELISKVPTTPGIRFAGSELPPKMAVDVLRLRWIDVPNPLFFSTYGYWHAARHCCFSWMHCWRSGAECACFMQLPSWMLQLA